MKSAAVRTALFVGSILAASFHSALCSAQENEGSSGSQGGKLPVASKSISEQSPLLIEIAPIASRLRSHAPMPVDVKLLWRGKELLDGHLEVSFRFASPSIRYGGQTLFRWRNEFSLTPGTRTTRVWLPAVEVPDQLVSLEAESRFVTKKGKEIPLRKAEFRIPIRGRLDALIGVVHPDGRPLDGGDFSVLKQLQWESFTTHDQITSPIVTTIHMLPLKEAPTRGLQYLAFDIVVVTPGALKELRPKQVDALVQWVEAGGSVLVMLDRPVDATLHRLLNRLAGGADRIPRDDLPEADAPVRLVSKASLRRFHSGMGRFALMRGPVDPGLFATEERWRDAALFLWKTTAEITTRVREGQKPQLAQNNSQPYGPPAAEWTEPQIRPRLQAQNAYRTNSGATISADDLVDTLMSSSVASLSLAATVGILGLFVFAIGPFDWFVLGWMRRRPLTWILLPLTSIAFLVLTMRWAQSRLGAADVRRSLIVLDVADDGRVVRRCQFELIVAGQAKTVEFEASNAIVSPFPPGAEPAQNPSRASPRYASDVDDSPRHSDPPAEWAGVPPGGATMSRFLRQWSPRLNRRTSFEADADVPPRAFLEVTRASVAALGGVDAVAGRLRTAEPNSFVLVYHGKSFLLIDRTGQRLETVGLGLVVGLDMLPVTVDAMTVAPQVRTGVFSLAAQRSPDGADRFDDLVLHDTTDPRQSTVVQVVPRGDDWIVYRKVFHAPSEDR